MDCGDPNTSVQNDFVLIGDTFWVVAVTGPSFIAGEIKRESGVDITVRSQMLRNNGHSDQPTLVIVTGHSDKTLLTFAILCRLRVQRLSVGL